MPPPLNLSPNPTTPLTSAAAVLDISHWGILTLKGVEDHVGKECALSILIVAATLTILLTPIWAWRAPLSLSALPHPTARVRAGPVTDSTKDMSPQQIWSVSQWRSLSSFNVSLCISAGVQLLADNSSGVIPGWTHLQPQLFGPCWPALASVDPWF